MRKALVKFHTETLIWQMYFNADAWPEVCTTLALSTLSNDWKPGRGGGTDYRLRVDSHHWGWVTETGFDSVIQLSDDDPSDKEWVDVFMKMFGRGVRSKDYSTKVTTWSIETSSNTCANTSTRTASRRKKRASRSAPT